MWQARTTWWQTPYPGRLRHQCRLTLQAVAGPSWVETCHCRHNIIRPSPLHLHPRQFVPLGEAWPPRGTFWISRDWRRHRAGHRRWWRQPGLHLRSSPLFKWRERHYSVMCPREQYGLWSLRRTDFPFFNRYTIFPMTVPGPAHSWLRPGLSGLGWQQILVPGWEIVSNVHWQKWTGTPTHQSSPSAYGGESSLTFT